MSEESGEKVPLWIISFADMITLLLSFFVMLQTMSHARDAALLGLSQESFRRSIAGMGMPDLFYGKGGQLDIQYRKIRHAMEERPTEQVNPGRIIDADDEYIRKMFDRIQKESDATSSDESPRVLSIVQAPVSFERGSSELSDSGKTALDILVRSLLQGCPAGFRRVAVIGWAGDEPTEELQWMTSAKRAGEVERYMRAALIRAGQTQWQVFSWGVGTGTPKLQALGMAPKKSSVLIAVMTAGE